MLSLLAYGLKALKLVTKLKLSKRTYLKLIKQTTGIVIAEEAIDLVAEHNEWVKENQTLLLMALVLGSATSAAFGGLKRVVLTNIGKPALFIKLSYGKMRQQAIPFIKEGIVKVKRNGVEVMFSNGHFIRIVRDLSQRKLVIDHSGSPFTAALLATGFGGAAFSDELDWQASGENILVAGGVMLANMQEVELQDELRSFDAVDLMSSQASIARSMVRKYPLLSSEEVVSCIITVLTEEEQRYGEHYVIAHSDEDGDIIYSIDGVPLTIDDSNDTLALAEANGVLKEISIDETTFGAALSELMTSVDTLGGVLFNQVPSTNRFVSRPFGSSEAAIVFDWNEELKEMRLRTASSSAFDSAIENATDSIESGFWEEVGVAFDSSAFGKWVSNSSDEKDNTSKLLADADSKDAVEDGVKQFEIDLMDILNELSKPVKEI